MTQSLIFLMYTEFSRKTSAAYGEAALNFPLKACLVYRGLQGCQVAVFYANVAVSYKAVYFSNLTRVNVPVILERNKVKERQRDG